MSTIFFAGHNKTGMLKDPVKKLVKGAFKR